MGKLFLLSFMVFSMYISNYTNRVRSIISKKYKIDTQNEEVLDNGMRHRRPEVVQPENRFGPRQTLRVLHRGDNHRAEVQIQDLTFAHQSVDQNVYLTDNICCICAPFALTFYVTGSCQIAAAVECFVVDYFCVNS